ncbi:hypothetical protein DL93DRAFT_921858 [Clavulina sp. PMI_390]|nr:hypothetical protein DL93DRAFT_921858 [Clavulina sp. PMI_390]
MSHPPSINTALERLSIHNKSLSEYQHGLRTSLGSGDTEIHDPLSVRREQSNSVPFFQLPYEIISYISLLAMLPLDRSIWKNPLLAVNSWWRSCVINTPQIWSCIHIYRTPPADVRFRCWLDRSGQACPLHLTVEDIDLFKAIEASWADGDHIHNPSWGIYSVFINSSTNSSVFLFPLQFNTINLHELVAYFPNTRQPCHIPLFNQNPPKRLKKLELSSHYFQPALIDSVGIIPSELTSLVLADDINYDKVLILLAQSPKLIKLEWKISISASFSTLKGPGGIRHVPLHDLKRLVFHGRDSLLDILNVIETPNVRQMCLSGVWEDDQTPSLVTFVSQCPMVIHLELINDASISFSAKQVAYMLHALPNLEWFDPEWRDINIRGLLALRGEDPGPRIGEQGSSPQRACPMINRLCLRLGTSVKDGVLSRRTLSWCLRRVLEVRAPPLAQRMDSAESVGAPSLPSGLLAVPRLKVVVDIDTATMASVMGEPWSHWGGENVESLRFPGELL